MSQSERNTTDEQLIEGKKSTERRDGKKTIGVVKERKWSQLRKDVRVGGREEAKRGQRGDAEGGRRIRAQREEKGGEDVIKKVRKRRIQVQKK